MCTLYLYPKTDINVYNDTLKEVKLLDKTFILTVVKKLTKGIKTINEDYKRDVDVVISVPTKWISVIDKFGNAVPTASARLVANEIEFHLEIINQEGVLYESDFVYIDEI